MGNAAGMRWRRPSGKARYRQIEAAPEEMHRTAFPAEARTKLFENAICLQKHAPEAVGIVQIISGVILILIEGDRFQRFVRFHSNLYLNPEFSEIIHYRAIKTGAILRLQRDHTLIALCAFCRDNT